MHFVRPSAVRAKRGDAIRIWSAGCALGQEVYTLAILFAEVMGLDAMRERMKIYAADADDEVLTQARTATYTERGVKALPEAWLKNILNRIMGDLRSGTTCGAR